MKSGSCRKGWFDNDFIVERIRNAIVRKRRKSRDIKEISRILKEISEVYTLHVEYSRKINREDAELTEKGRR